jgi:hypothetical protein
VNENEFSFAIVDGIEEKIENYKIEPPGLFSPRGHGENSKMVILALRVLSNLNIGRK